MQGKPRIRPFRIGTPNFLEVPGKPACGVGGPVGEPQHWAKRVGACEANKVKARDRGLELGRQYGCLLHRIDRGDELLIQKWQPAQVGFVARGGYQVIGLHIELGTVLLYELQVDPAALDFGFLDLGACKNGDILQV